MARPRRCRRVCSEPDYSSFMPDGIPCSETVTLAVDEYEVIRLLDLMQMTQEQCALRMGISRPTVTRIYDEARRKMADMLVSGRNLQIGGGDVYVCPEMRPECAGAAARAAKPRTRRAGCAPTRARSRPPNPSGRRR